MKWSGNSCCCQIAIQLRGKFGWYCAVRHYHANHLRKYDTIRYDTIEEFNVDSKAEYKLNLAHVARN